MKMPTNTLRIAAIGDIHTREKPKSSFKAMFSRISAEAEVLLICGDLTDRGLIEEAKSLADDLSACTVPVLGVLGNHDHQNKSQNEIRKILSDANMIFIDEEPEIVKNCGFAGVKGFGGGFENHMLSSFGEDTTKEFVQISINEALHLENLLGRITTPKIVTVLHYSPVKETVKGEPLEIYMVLGSSRLAETIDRYPVNLVFHGHAHYGALFGKTKKGTPVYNCAHELLKRKTGKDYMLIDI